MDAILITAVLFLIAFDFVNILNAVNRTSMNYSGSISINVISRYEDETEEIPPHFIQTLQDVQLIQNVQKSDDELELINLSNCLSNSIQIEEVGNSEGLPNHFHFNN